MMVTTCSPKRGPEGPRAGSARRSAILAAGLMVAPITALVAGPPGARAPDALPVYVDPRAELVAVVFRLAGSDAYVRPQSRSPYADEVAEWFANQRDHEAVRLARDLQRRRGISYDAPMTLAMHLDGVPSLALTVPLDPWPERLDRRWTDEDIEAFLPALRDFASASRFGRFFEEHEALYREASARLAARLETAGLLDWARAWFGVDPDPGAVRVHPGLLQGGNNFGCGVRHPDGSYELCPILGAWEWDDDGFPVFGAGHVPIAVHEFAHSYVNPLVDAHAAALDPIGDVLFASDPAAFTRQAYDSGRIVLYETIVRASVVRYVATASGDAAAARAGAEDAARGFTWVPALAAGFAAKYESDRALYPDLASFVTPLVELLERQADVVAERLARTPRVVSTSPADGADDVDPALAEIRVEFDRPMRADRYSVLVGDAAFPEVAGKPAFDASGTVFVLPVRLKPSETYEFGINGPGNDGFCARDGGVPAQAVRVRFRTRAP